ncbi:MAG: hypothetical protein EPO08_11880 [Rhodospirillaceae bacterium]|nr:MAG: hypothetical protein EPO08_11880 [Rhodospirillaceae bacterium]
MAALGAGAPGLLIGSILGQSAGTFGLLNRVLGTRKELLKAISWRRMMFLANRYRRFPLIASWTAVLDAAGSNQLLYLLVSTQYSTTIAGFIFLVERVVARPLSMVGTSILQVFVAEAGQTASTDPEKLKRRFRQIVIHQFYLAIAWVALANVAAIAFFPLAFGPDWSGAIVYLQAMSLGYLAQAIVLPVFHTLQLLERQVTAATWQISRVVLTVAIFALGAHFGVKAPWVIFSYSVLHAAACGILLLLMESAIKKLPREKR